MQRRHQIISTLLAGILLSTAATAQKRRAAADDPDQKEIFACVLTMDKIQQMAKASIALMDYSKRHPELESKDSDARTIDETVAKLNRYPEVVSVIKAAGLSPREYFVAYATFLQASIAVGSKKSGLYKEYPPDMLKLVNKANLDLFEQHFAEIQKLTASINQSSGKDQ